MPRTSRSAHSFWHISLMVLLCSVASVRHVSAAEPTLPSSFLQAEVAGCNELFVHWTPGDGAGHLVIGRADSAVSAFPADSNFYAADTVFGTGTDLGNGNFVLYDGADTSFTVTGLTGGIHYYFAEYEFNGSGISADFLTSAWVTADERATGIVLTVSATDTVICSGQSTQLEAHGAYSCTWSPAADVLFPNDTFTLASPPITTLYTVIATDTNACQDTARIFITVNFLPGVSLPSFAPLCSNAAPLMLVDGFPYGGVYAGTGVDTGYFFPTMSGDGVFNISYTVTDTIGCSSTASSDITVFPAPVVQLTAPADLCANAAAVTLTGSPAGGSFSGTGVSGDQFDPTVVGDGTFTVSYAYADSNSCSAADSALITVHSLPVIVLNLPASVCANAAPLTLTGALPAGGTYTVDGASQSVLDPAQAIGGSPVVAYTYTDTYGCSASDSATISVHAVAGSAIAWPVCAYLCSDIPNTIYALSGFVSWDWFTGDTTPLINYIPSWPDTSELLWLNATDSNGCVVSDSLTVPVVVCEGVGTVSREEAFRFYPNPFSEVIRLRSETAVSLRVFDISGACVIDEEAEQSDRTFGQKLAPGIFMAAIRHGNQVTFRRIIKTTSEVGR